VSSGIADIRRSPRARRIRVVADDLGVHLVVPSRVGLGLALGFLESNRTWVDRHANVAVARRATLESWRGYRMLEGERSRFDGDIAGLRKECGSALKNLVASEADRTGLQPTVVALRAMRSRWGSCSSGGRVCLNWRLGMAPERVRRYVVIHELAHLKHGDHSSRFWALVHQWWPEWRTDKAWLREHGWLVANLPHP